MLRLNFSRKIIFPGDFPHSGKWGSGTEFTAGEPEQSSLARSGNSGYRGSDIRNGLYLLRTDRAAGCLSSC